MAEPTDAPENSTEVDPEEETEVPEDDGTEDEDKPLGPKGEKALAAEKERRKAAEKTAREEKAARAELEKRIARLEAGGETEEARAAREAQEKREAEVLSKANERILKADVRAAAAHAKFNDPHDAVLNIDLSKFEVGEDGSTDEEAIKEAIADLLKSKPYLAAQGGKGFEGTVDGGARPQKPKRATSLDDAIAQRYTK